MIKIFHTAIIITFISFCLSCKSKKNSETEPNDQFSKSNIIRSGESYSGHLSTPEDIDNYYYKCETSEILTFSLSGLKGVNHAIKIWKVLDKNPVLLKFVDDSRKSSPEEFANLAVDPGEYVFSVVHGMKDIKKGNPDSEYSFSVVATTIMSHEKEPNDNKDMATVLKPGEKLSGYFSPGINFLNKENEFIEEDWFYFDIDSTVSIPVIFSASLSMVETADSVFVLYDSQLNELYRADINGPNQGERIPDIALRQSGRYYLKVFLKNFISNSDKPYELIFDLKGAEEGKELEPNNSIDRANYITDLGMSGVISTDGDVDFYRFSRDVSSVKKMEILADPGSSLKLEVLRKGTVADVYDKDRSSGRLIIPNLTVLTGDFIKVSGSYDGAKSNRYEIRTADLDDSEKFEKENNDTLKEANAIVGSISGFISRSGDKDYFRISTDSKKRFEIVIHGVKDGKINLSTTDSLGYIINTVDVTGDETKKISELINRKGFLIVESKSQSSENPYVISLKEIK